MDSCKLKDLGEIQTGLVIKRKMSDNSKGFKYKLLNLKSVNDGYIDKESMEDFVSSEKLSENILTQEGDIIIRLFAPFVCAVTGKEEKNFAVPSQLAVIRADKKKINPMYLCALINNNVIRLDNVLEGAGKKVQKVLKVGNLRELEIPMVSAKKQKVIGEIFRNQYKLNNLYKKLVNEENRRNSILIKSVMEK